MKERKAKVKICRCGNGIPTYSEHEVCFECLGKQSAGEKLGKLKENLKKTEQKTARKLKKKTKKLIKR